MEQMIRYRCGFEAEDRCRIGFTNGVITEKEDDKGAVVRVK